MSQDWTPDIISLLDENDQEFNFEVFYEDMRFYQI